MFFIRTHIIESHLLAAETETNHFLSKNIIEPHIIAKKLQHNACFYHEKNIESHIHATELGNHYFSYHDKVLNHICTQRHCKIIMIYRTIESHTCAPKLETNHVLVFKRRIHGVMYARNKIGI